MTSHRRIKQNTARQDSESRDAETCEMNTKIQSKSVLVNISIRGQCPLQGTDSDAPGEFVIMGFYFNEKNNIDKS